MQSSDMVAKFYEAVEVNDLIQLGDPGSKNYPYNSPMNGSVVRVDTNNGVTAIDVRMEGSDEIVSVNSDKIDRFSQWCWQDDFFGSVVDRMAPAESTHDMSASGDTAMVPLTNSLETANMSSIESKVDQLTEITVPTLKAITDGLNHLMSGDEMQSSNIDILRAWNTMQD